MRDLSCLGGQPSTFTAVGLPAASVVKDIFSFQWFETRLRSSRREMFFWAKLNGGAEVGRFYVS